MSELLPYLLLLFGVAAVLHQLVLLVRGVADVQRRLKEMEAQERRKGLIAVTDFSEQ